MDIEKFKKESKVTYVFIHAEPHGVFVVKAYNMHEVKRSDNLFNYNGYIVVPFAYNDFISFSEKQQIAICEAELIKSGLCFKVKNCDPKYFYKTDD
jgi:hypothetical protein